MKSAFFVLLAASLAAPSAWADVPKDGAAAEALFADGRALMARGQIAEACGKFEASLSAERAVGTLLNLANCYELLGRTASAWAAFREAAPAARSAGSREREEVAKARAAALEKRLCKLVIRAAPSTRVLRDGAPVEPAAFGTAIPVDPGNHVVEATAAGKKPWSRSLTVSGDGVQIELEIPDLAASEPAAPAASGAPAVAPSVPAAAPDGTGPARLAPASQERSNRSDGSLQRTAAIGAGVVGVAGIAVMTYFGLHASSLWDDARSRCASYPTACEQPAPALSRDALSAANVATVGGIVGGVGLAAAAILWFSAPPRAGAPRERSAVTSLQWAIGPSGAVVRGAF